MAFFLVDGGICSSCPTFNRLGPTPPGKMNSPSNRRTCLWLSSLSSFTVNPILAEVRRILFVHLRSSIKVDAETLSVFLNAARVELSPSERPRPTSCSLKLSPRSSSADAGKKSRAGIYKRSACADWMDLAAPLTSIAASNHLHSRAFIFLVIYVQIANLPTTKLALKTS